MTSPLGQMWLLPPTFDRIEIDQWGVAQCVSLAKPHHSICNMTYRGHHVTSGDLELRSNFDPGC